MVLAFVTHDDAGPAARRALAAFGRVTLAPGASTKVTLPIDSEPLTIVDEQGTRRPATGTLTFTVGNLSTTIRAARVQPE